MQVNVLWLLVLIGAVAVCWWKGYLGRDEGPPPLVPSVAGASPPSNTLESVVKDIMVQKVKVEEAKIKAKLHELFGVATPDKPADPPK